MGMQPFSFQDAAVTDAFSFDAHPFNCLSPAEQVLVRDSASRVAFPKSAALLSPGVEPSQVFVIIRGHVEQEEADDVVVFGPGDHVGFRSVMTARVNGPIVALDEVEAWRIPRETAQALLSACR